MSKRLIAPSNAPVNVLKAFSAIRTAPNARKNCLIFSFPLSASSAGFLNLGGKPSKPPSPTGFLTSSVKPFTLAFDLSASFPALFNSSLTPFNAPVLASLLASSLNSFTLVLAFSAFLPVSSRPFLTSSKPSPLACLVASAFSSLIFFLTLSTSTPSTTTFISSFPSAITRPPFLLICIVL